MFVFLKLKTKLKEFLKMHGHKSKFENKGLRTKLKQEGFEKEGEDLKI